MAFSERVLMPLIGKFLLEHQGAEIELDPSTNTKNLRSEGFDLSIRIMAHFDVETDHVVLLENRRHFYASRDYLAERVSRNTHATWRSLS